MALLTFLEKEWFKVLEAQSLSASKRNRDVKKLEGSINYDNQGEEQSSHSKRKGRGSNVVS
jgi:hypothetical protein